MARSYIWWDDATREQRIERVENGIRVLRSLTKHQRAKHWDMGDWGVETKCGTVACAAGWMGLDSWFRRQGLWMTPGRRNAKWLRLSVTQFFGDTLVGAVFLNSARRPVDDVIKELQGYLFKLRISTEAQGGAFYSRHEAENAAIALN